MKQQSLRIIILLLFSVLMLLPIQLVRAEHWVEVVRFEGRRDIFTTAPFVCNYSVWRIRYESYSGDRFPMIIPGVYTLNITIYRQGETTDYIDRISEEPTQGMYYYHLIRNNTGSFYMNISTGYSDSYSIIVEQNTDSVFVTLTPIPSPTPINSNTENNSASPLGLSLEIIAALVVMFVAAFAAVLLVLRRKSFRRNLMPKKLLATIIIIALVITMLSSVSMVSANFVPAGLLIQSPGGLIYSGDNSTSIPLWIEVIVPTGASPISSISYCVDEGANITLSRIFYTTYYPANSPYNMDVYYNRNEKLDNLTDGKHTVRAYSIDNSGNKMMSDLAVFTVQKNGKTGIFLSGFPNGYPQPNTSITPIIPYPTMTQTPSIIPTATLSSDYWQNPTFFTALAVVVTIVAVVSISLVYFRRRRGKQ